MSFQPIHQLNLAIAVFTLLALSSLAVAQTEAPPDRAASVFEELIDLAVRTRARPLTEFKNVSSNLTSVEESGNFISGDTLVLAETTTEFVFYLQANICHNKANGSTYFGDATILGPRESASTFYSDNEDFYISDPLLLSYCAVGGERMMYVDRPDGRMLGVSPDRAFRHMCGWLLYFGMYEPNIGRGRDFLMEIVRKKNETFRFLGHQENQKELASALAFFGKVFPYKALGTDLQLTKAERAEVSSFFHTMIALRKRARVWIPETGDQIPAEEEIIRRLQ